MRLSEFQIAIINRLAIKYFGQDTTVFLFGFRADDGKKGGY